MKDVDMFCSSDVEVESDGVEECRVDCLFSSSSECELFWFV